MFTIDEKHGPKCVVCGRDIPGGEICEECEKEVLEEVGSHARIISLIAMQIFLLILLGIWWVYGPVIMEIWQETFKNYPLAFEISFKILRSRHFFVVLMGLAFLVMVRIFYEVYYKRIVLDKK